MDMTTPGALQERCTILSDHLSRFGDRWTLPVVVSLREEPLRFNRLRRVVGISQQMLTRTLRTLERDGMVSRTVHPTVPPQVEYALTPVGASLAEQAVLLGTWIDTHSAQIEHSRDEFDAREGA